MATNKNSVKKAAKAKPKVVKDDDLLEELVEDEGTGEVSEEVEGEAEGEDEVEGETEKPEKAEKVVVEIIRGRMPVAVVAVIKINTVKDAKDADVAVRFRTTNGKVSDVRTGRNFGYVNDTFKPTAEQVEQAKVYVDQLNDSEAIMGEIEALGVATKEEATAFAESRKSTRKTAGKPKAEPEAEADVDAEAEPEAEAEPTAEDLEGDDDLDDLLDD